MTGERPAAPGEPCPSCGFAASRWSDQDLLATVELLPGLVELWAAPAEAVTTESAALVDALLAGLTPGGPRLDLADVIHRAWHALDDIAVAVARAGAGTGAARSDAETGVVRAINRSGGGVPKQPVEEAIVTVAGVDGDRQRVRRHHGRPWQAVSLWSAEVIDALASDGHPVRPGGTGENLTLSGVDWSALHGGTVLTVGEDEPVRLQLSSPATPCATIAHNFADRDFRVIDHGRHPGRSRWYASVLRPGPIRIGDPVRAVSPWG